MKQKYTIKNLKKDFGNEKKCLEYLLNLKCIRPNHCPKCNKFTKFYFIKSKKRFDTNCKHSIYPTKNTIYYNSSTPLTIWFQAIFMFSVSKNGVSAKELERMLGVTYKTAWRMANKIRSLMKDKIKILSGIVEMDETYVGGKEINKHKDKKSLTAFTSKIPVIGMKSRNSNLVANVENNVQKSTLSKNIYKYIQKGSLIITDESPNYYHIKKEKNYFHKKINHSKKEYARYEVIDKLYNEIMLSTNSIENFWSIFKRSVKGTYIRLSKKWLQSYIDEFVFRFNHKEKILFKEIIERLIK